MMEADSTTDSCTKAEELEPVFPFNTLPGDLQLYKEFTNSHGDQKLEFQLVARLQAVGLLPKVMKCPTNNPNCKVFYRAARVVDRIQWICECCTKRQPIRTGSFFFRIQCSILQTVQIIFAWCEDVTNVELAANHFGVKTKVALQIYDRLDELAIKEQNKFMMGGNNSVVVAEMYPDCVNSLSPDTTEQPHAHRILMLADTNHIPTCYRLHVMKNDNKKTASGAPDTQAFKSEIEELVRRVVIPGSEVVMGINVPLIGGTSSVQQLFQHCDADMQNFLSTRIWRQALAVCSASRLVCSEGVPLATCGATVQRYLTTALYRLRHGDGFFRHVLGTIADEYTDRTREAREDS